MWIALFIIGIVLLILLGNVLFKKDNSNAAKLMNKYRYMTAELLQSTSDDELIKAVVANLLAKAEDARMDAYAVIPTLSQKCCAVYSVWLFMREVESGEPELLRRDEQFGFSELAADGLDLLGFTDVAADLRDYLQTEDEARVPSMKAPVDSGELTQALITMIRDDPAEFCDGDRT